MEKKITNLETLDVSNLDNFTWDSDASELDFFGEVVTKPEKSPEETEKEEEIVEKEKKDKEEKEEEENLFDVFTEDRNDEEDTEDDSQEEDKKNNKKSKTTSVVEKTDAVLDFFKRQTSLELTEEELEELEELDEEDKQAALEDYFEKALDEKLAASMKDLPDSVKNIVKYAAKGGDVNTFLKTLYKEDKDGLSEDLDIKKESNQEKVVRLKLEEEEYDEEYIESHIEFLKDSGKLEITAEKHFNKWLANKKKVEAETLEEINNQRKLQKENQLKFKKDIKTFVSETEEIKGFKLSKKDIEDLPNYISEQDIKLNDGRTITPFYRDFFEALKDKNKLIVLAKILKSDFDFSSLTKNIDTKRTRELKDNLQRQAKTKNIKSTSGNSQQPKRLIDIIG